MEERIVGNVPMDILENIPTAHKGNVPMDILENIPTAHKVQLFVGGYNN